MTLNKMNKSLKDAVNVDKINEIYPKYKLAKQLSELYLFDTEYVKEKINFLIEKGVIIMLDKNEEVYNYELDCYTPAYAIHIWRECVLPSIGIDYETYQAFDALSKMKI